MSAKPARTIEIEVTFDAATDTPLPDWTALPGVVAVSGPEIRDLDAQYFDTADGVLARAGVAVRRRTGGPDEGWHVKGPIIDGARTELQWPLSSDDALPEGVRGEVERWTAEPVTLLARIRNERHAYALLDIDGGVVAEMVDDHVQGWDARAQIERTWREWELELGPAAPVVRAERDAFFEAAAALALASGAGPAASASKLARTMGH